MQCGLCEKVCAFNKDYSKGLNLQKPDVYAVRHKEMKEIEGSRRGYVCCHFRFCIRQGGVVYGVGYTGHFRVSHKRASTRKERDEFRGSKYVQSDLNGIFVQVKDDLKQEGFMFCFQVLLVRLRLSYVLLLRPLLPC